MPDKICFVIAPIGEEGSDIRKRSDRMFTYVIEPAAKECGYKAVRADKISKPGIITNQVIQEVIGPPMVVADLTGRNANAFYELAIRHMVKHPLVQMITKGEAIPFEYVYDGATLLTQTVVGRKVIRTLSAGERLQCSLAPSRIQEGPVETTTGLGSLAQAARQPTVETADVLAVWLEDTSELFYVEREAIQILAIPKDDPFIRRMCPHLYGG
jgi:hypothetical protein